MNREPAVPKLHPPTSMIGQPLIWGSLCGIVAAVGYTAANIFLRSVSECDPIWVSCVKSFPTVLFAGPWLVWRSWHGDSVVPAPRVVGALLLGGFIGQLFGNVAFQWSLGVIGMALAIPLTMGTIIISGAVLGRIFLHESVTPRSIVSMSFLILAICTLSLGAKDAFRSVVQSGQAIAEADGGWRLTGAVAAACLAGVAYSALGVVIRHGVSGRASVAMTLFIVGAVGTLSLGTLSLWRLGLSAFETTNHEQWLRMVLAGVCNFVAFLALAKALQLTTVVYVNSLNASQVAMGAVAGVLLFREAPTAAMWTGVGLTAFGLILIGSRRRRIE